MSWFWNSWWPFTLLVTPFFIAISGQALTVYMVYHDLERVRDTFPNSQLIRNQMKMWSGAGFTARYMQLNVICGAICLQRYYVKRGQVNLSEMAKVPAGVRARARWSSTLLAVAIVWFAIAVLAIKHFKP
ncbi:hypothetical protein [Pseudomonas sp. 5P_3.1_Bac2]|uniref:hypothetical protein n=1 Tax=Pseudomonas sp. 5P_3.1_Bac2 TaxID=2971617 RepID=UPI0021C90A28|nr:hypothetical protein [Pseudomonas sp. 5P_3.1_Bac2]MCU1717297.1 hypothetical protein [Pseudomonas sp. 5P_3.1_Bac2]